MWFAVNIKAACAALVTWLGCNRNGRASACGRAPPWLERRQLDSEGSCSGL